MESKYLIWFFVIGSGALFGAFLRLGVVLWVVAAVVILTFTGGFGAAFLRLIQPEWLLLLMVVLPAALVFIVSAALTNLLVGPDARRIRSRDKGQKFTINE